LQTWAGGALSHHDAFQRMARLKRLPDCVYAAESVHACTLSR